MLKPVELQMLIPRSFDIQRIQQAQNNRPTLEQQQCSQEMAQVHREEQNRVGASSLSDANQKISSNTPRQTHSRYRRFYSKSKDEKTETEDPNDSGHHIDIKI